MKRRTGILSKYSCVSIRANDYFNIKLLKQTYQSCPSDLCVCCHHSLFIRAHFQETSVLFSNRLFIGRFSSDPVTLGEIFYIWVHFGLFILWSFKQTFPPANVGSSAQRVDRGVRQTGVISGAPQVGESA